MLSFVSIIDFNLPQFVGNSCIDFALTVDKCGCAPCESSVAMYTLHIQYYHI